MVSLVVIIILFLAALGACVGSFLNVVIYRMPEGKSIVTPGSYCPRCNTSLKWYENIPVFAWLALRGRCRHCGEPISGQYPLIEAICAFLFVILFYAYYYTSLNQSFSFWGLPQTWPVYAVHVVLIAALLAATLIDARHYIIPLGIPWTVSVVALVALSLYTCWQPTVATESTDPLVPAVGTNGVHMAIGGMLGLGVAVLLLQLKLLPRSFDDEEAEALDAMSTVEADSSGDSPPDVDADAAEAEGSTGPVGLRAVRMHRSEASDWAGSLDARQALGDDTDVSEPGEADDTPVDDDDSSESGQAAASADENRQRIESFLSYSHPRREVLKECLFVAMPIAVMVAVMWHMAGQPLVHPGYPPVVRVLGGVCCGYLVGGGLIWLTRILGTLAFGREAMGLGDVHLLAAIGAVLGVKTVVIVFFVAPFLGLIYVALAVGVNRVVRGRIRIIPFGPYLALATLIMMLGHEPIIDFVDKYYGPLLDLFLLL